MFTLCFHQKEPTIVDGFHFLPFGNQPWQLNIFTHRRCSMVFPYIHDIPHIYIYIHTYISYDNMYMIIIIIIVAVVVAVVVVVLVKNIYIYIHIIDDCR